MKKAVKIMQTDMDSLTLAFDSRINSPARAVKAMKENGLTTRDAIEDDECRKEGNCKHRQSSQATGQKYGFVHVISSHNALIMNTAGVRVNG